MWAASYGWHSAGQALELALQVAAEGFMAEGPAAHLLHQLGGIHAAAQGVHPLLQPGTQLRIAIGLKQGFDRPEFGFQGFAELGADQMAQGIGGEVAKQAL